MCPRLFSVLGGAVTRASLQQVQHDVDTLVEVSAVSTKTSPSSPGPISTPSVRGSASSLRRVLEVLRAASLTSNNSDNTESDAVTAPFFTSSSASPEVSDMYVRDTLMHALGVPAGSALFRECIAAPRLRVQQIVKQLVDTVRSRYLPLLNARSTEQQHHHHFLTSGEPLDVHVQLYPSTTVASMSVVPAALRAHRGFVAAITVRRLPALEEEAAVGQRLQSRYMSVAAPGQTLASALSFWSDVSYGDTPPAALAGYPPLGFEMDEVAGCITTPQIYGGNPRVEEWRQPGQKAPRSVREKTAATTEDTAEASIAVLLGLPVDKEKLSAEANGLPTFVQPGFLVNPSAEVFKGESRSDGRDNSRKGAPLPHVAYPQVGIVAVLYVHCSGVAYVGYPSRTVSQLDVPGGAAEKAASPTMTAVAAAPIATADTTVGKDDVRERPAKQPRVCTLPMLSSTGFTRSLLGLS